MPHFCCEKAPPQTSNTLAMNESEAPPAVPVDSWTRGLSLHNDGHVNNLLQNCVHGHNDFLHSLDQTPVLHHKGHDEERQLRRLHSLPHKLTLCVPWSCRQQKGTQREMYRSQQTSRDRKLPIDVNTVTVSLQTVLLVILTMMPSIMGLTTTKETQRPKSSSNQRRGAQQNVNLHHVRLETTAIQVQRNVEITTAVEIVRSSSNRRRGATKRNLHCVRLDNAPIPVQTDGDRERRQREETVLLALRV